MQDQEIAKGSDAGVGIITPQKFVSYEPPEVLELESGQKLGQVTQVYETYGELNAGKSNGILLFHALSGDHHAAGKHDESETKPGWWDNLIGPGKAFDTDKSFVICANVIGGCSGTTGPSSINPETQTPYAMDFPVVTIKDMINAQKKLIDHLGIKQLYAVAGASMAGMMAFDWAVTFPETVKHTILIATTHAQSPQNIGLQEIGRRAIMSDPVWSNGNYTESNYPKAGLGVARMLAHVSYLSDHTSREKFGRRIKNGDNPSYTFDPEFEIETYLDHQAEVFVDRFDPNSYLYITKAIDYFDMTKGGKLQLTEVVSDIQSDVLLLSFKSDWLYPIAESNTIQSALKDAGKNVTHTIIDSLYGHDACFIETEKMTPPIREFLLY